ncbi:hypothetical protein LTS18_004971, partial [Coniosporium uncinatum]
RAVDKFGLHNLVEALHELVATVPHEKQRLLFEALDLVGQLGLMAEMRRRIDIIIPGPEKALKGLGQNPVARNDALLTKLCESIRSFGKRGSTIPSHFEYPAHWRRTKATVNAMRLAETQLDAFWTAFDEHLQEDLGGHLHEHLSIEHRTVHWTLLWGDTLLKRREATPPAPAVVAGLSALTLEDASDGATSSLLDKNPRFSATQYPRPPTTPEPWEIIAVFKRPLSTFRALFPSLSSAAEQAKEISWTGFLQAMVAAGFTPEKLHGSGWSFASTRSEGAAMTKRSISFHEPYGIPGMKLPFWWVRRYGRRLTRAFGWDWKTFVAK